MNRKALSLLEIIISMVILALVITGLINVFISGRELIKDSRYRMSAGEISKLFIDPLQYYVRQDTWNSSCFGTNSLANTTNGSYTANYTISNLSNNTTNNTLKKVKTIVQWAP
ncbi:MAG: prepilin-type N-terminal cleavage/methylation domain-containing protein [Candidatus Omnitrophota bacterium]